SFTSSRNGMLRLMSSSRPFTSASFSVSGSCHTIGDKVTVNDCNVCCMMAALGEGGGVMVQARESRGERSLDEDTAGEVGRSGRDGRGGRPRNESLDEAIILATRDRLVRDGYSRMTIGDIAADAGVTRPTLYRRWPGKFELVVDALDYGFRKQRDMYTIDPAELAPRDALVEAVRRLDPAYFNPEAMVLMGNF